MGTRRASRPSSNSFFLFALDIDRETSRLIGPLIDQFFALCSCYHPDLFCFEPQRSMIPAWQTSTDRFPEHFGSNGRLTDHYDRDSRTLRIHDNSRKLQPSLFIDSVSLLIRFLVSPKKSENVSWSFLKNHPQIPQFSYSFFLKIPTKRAFATIS